ncbi:MAG: hypothetical protein A4E71_02554 [Smithella sp. PtaU1.Bin162]|nr:MAG: hypothetical protein A4E71_02554 [Smithella sp. PtaU1.Bin162]
MGQRRLNTIQDLRRYLANLINRTENGQIDAALARSLTYMTSILMRAIEGGDLEKRIEELENKMLKGEK